MTDNSAATLGLESLATEGIDERHDDLDTRPTIGVLEAMNDAEASVPGVVRAALPAVAALVDEIAQRLREGGRIIYVGAGTSGRLGILDAAECPPTFHVPPDVVRALMAGGDQAMFGAVEAVEDSEAAGAQDVADLGVGPHDTVVGIAASGRTPYVLGAVRAARDVGALTAGISCNSSAELSAEVAHPIEVEVGPEVIAGSTRLKAGSATKQILNMISSAVMVRIGKTYGNLMVDVTISNSKLRDRGVRLLSRITGCDRHTAERVLDDADGRVKVAAVMVTRGLSRTDAQALLDEHDGRLRPILGEHTSGR